MNVEIWSDIVCPWCGLGQRRLENALADFEHRVQVELVHRSFELDPTFSGPPQPVREFLAKKYRASAAQLEATWRRLEALAADEGLVPYILADNLIGNTRLAHELLAMASAQGLEREAWAHLYRAYFGDRRSIFELEVLVELGSELGLEAAAVRSALSTARYRSRVEADESEARALGVTGVPFVAINRRFVVAGAQPTQVFRQALERGWLEREA